MNEERLKELATQLYDITLAEKKAKELRETLREEFFELALEDHEGKGHLLPIVTIEVPSEFWETTDLTLEQFLSTRFPGWVLQHHGTDDASDVLILQKDPKYLPSSYEVDGIKVKKMVSEFTPEIDWQTLQEELPDVFEKLARPITTYEMDDDKFQVMIQEWPEILSVIRRHVKVKQPTLKVQASKMKEQDGKTDSE